MKASELRIGNYLFDSTEDGGIIKIKEIKEMSPRNVGNMSISYIGVRGGYCTTSLQENEVNLESEDFLIQPIPLTEEWLLDFGFELINNDFYRSRNSELCLHWTVNKNKMIPEYNQKRLVTGYDFKYVHQLQNLYFALTGEELTLQES